MGFGRHGATFLAVHVRATFGALLGSSWKSLGCLLATFGRFWALLWVVLASSWGLLGALGGLSGTSGDLFWPTSAHIGVFLNVIKTSFVPLGLWLLFFEYTCWVSGFWGGTLPVLAGPFTFYALDSVAFLSFSFSAPLWFILKICREKMRIRVSSQETRFSSLRKSPSSVHYFSFQAGS